VKLGLLPTVSFAYEQMPDDLGSRACRAADDAAAVLSRELGDEIVLVDPISTESEGLDAGRQLADAGVYATVVLPALATMAAVPWAALEAVDVPVLIWSRTESHHRPRDTVELVLGSAPVGAAAISNVLVRAGRYFRVANGPSLSERSLAFLRGARAARALDGAVFGHFGGAVWPGMLDVVLDRTAFKRAFAAEVVDLEPDFSSPPAKIEPELEVTGIAPEALKRSLALVGAVVGSCERAQVVAGAFNCHGDAFARNEEVGVVCCAAVNEMTARGVPFACTGDDCTAVALFLAQQIAGAAQYLELDAVDEELDACLVTSGGEGDLRLARADLPRRLRGNRFFSGLAGRGAALDFVLRPGPVTLIGFTPTASFFRVVAAGGEVLEQAAPDLGIPRAYVRFAGPAREAFDWWCEAGANHHLALAPGRHELAVEAFAEITRIEARVLSG
jgi:L-fucose isomerase-like protein